MYMTYKDLDAEQGKSLNDKISKAVEAIGEGFRVCKHTPALAFSGGKDSTVLWDLIRRYFPEEETRLHILYGNTGVEYPESLHFARELGQAWGSDRFHEVRPLKTDKDSLKYEAQCEVLQYLEQAGRLDEILKPDGKLKRTEILDEKCPPDMWEDFRRRHLIWKDADGEYHKIPRNGCMACGTDLLYPNNHLAMLRRTHPAAWRTFMKSGLAEAVRNLQQAKRGGQFSILDFIGDANYLVDTQPCAFDRIDRLVLEELSTNENMLDYDPEEVI